MNPPYATAIAAILAYLASRAAAWPLARKARGAAFGSLALAGILVGAAFRSIGARFPGGAFGLVPGAVSLLDLAAEAAGAVALYALASTFHAVRSPSRRHSRSNRSKSLALLSAVPIATGLALAIASRPWNTASVAGIAATVAAALWLSADVDAFGLAASTGAIVISRLIGPPGGSAWPLAAAAGLVLLRVALSYARKPALPDLKPAMSTGLAWAIASSGLGLAVSGLIAGMVDAAVDMARKSRRGPVASGNAPGAGAARLEMEASLALSFAVGLRVDPGALLDHWLSIAATFAAIALAAIARAAAFGEGKPAQPYVPAAYAVLVFNFAVPHAEAAIAGAALAYLAMAPFNSTEKRSAERSELRTLVGIDPDHGGACAAGFAAMIGPEGEPVRAICVATAESGAAKAEEALVRSVVAGAARGIRVLPSIATDSDVAAGLAKAAAERRAEAIVLGPIEDIKSAEREGTPLSSLLIAYGGAVVALDRPDPFDAGAKLVVAVFSGQEASPYFRASMEAVIRAWGNSPGSLSAVAIGGPAQALADAAFGLLQPRSVTETGSWREVPTVLGKKSGLSEGYRFVVFSSRPGSAHWNPGHERLPAVLAGAFPGSSTTLWFLPERTPAKPSRTAPAVESSADGTFDIGSELPPLLLSAYGAGRVMPGMMEDALVDAVRRLVSAILPDDKSTAAKLASDFSAIARREPIELAQGILLLHGYAKGITMPELAIGARLEGWPLVALPTPVRILVVLVSPAGSGPDAHLAALTQIALAFRSLGLADRLLG